MFPAAPDRVAVRLHGRSFACMLSATEALDSADRPRPRPIIAHVSARARDSGGYAAERIRTADPRLLRTPRPSARLGGLHYRATRRCCRRLSAPPKVRR